MKRLLTFLAWAFRRNGEGVKPRSPDEAGEEVRRALEGLLRWLYANSLKEGDVKKTVERDKKSICFHLYAANLFVSKKSRKDFNRVRFSDLAFWELITIRKRLRGVGADLLLHNATPFGTEFVLRIDSDFVDIQRFSFDSAIGSLNFGIVEARDQSVLTGP